MDIEKELQDIGLSKGESKVYISLLKQGAVQVNKLKEATGLNRTTIYDFLEKLMNKNLVSYYKENNSRIYVATKPEKLLDYIREKENKTEEIIPNLNSIKRDVEEKIEVEVFRGLEGVKTILNDILRVGKDYSIFGIDEELFEEKMGSFMDHFFRKQKQIGFKERILTFDSVKYIYSYDTISYRYLPSSSFNPTPTFVYGNTVSILIWEPLTVIRIRNEELFDSYQKYFEILWKIAKRKPKSAILKKK